MVYAHGTGGSLIDDRIDRAWPIRYAVEGSAYYRQDPYGINSRGIKHGTLPIVNFANLLKGFGCNEEMPVVLKVCETAKGGESFAKELSMFWRGPVVGADEKVWFSVNGADPTPHPMLDDDGPSRNINVMDTSIDGHYLEFVNGQFIHKISLQ